MSRLRSDAHYRASNSSGVRQIIRSFFVVAFVVTLFPIAAPLRAQSDRGTIEGRVLNVSSGNFLNNARIAVEGSNLETLTNENGEYRLPDVSAGDVRLKVSYAGMEGQTATVKVAPGEVARKDFDLALTRSQMTADKNVVQLENFVVESTALSAAAAAVNEQKMAPNIKNVIVLDEIGDLGDGNIGEYLKYTPGLSIVFGPQTAATTSIRGMPGSGVVFMVDGAEVSTPSADRSFDLAASSAGSVDRIEVTKVPTPDRPANAVGGTVNIIGKSGFTSPRRILKINTYAAYNSDNRLVPPGLDDRVGSDRHSKARAIQPGIDINYSHPVNKSFAFTINLSELTRVYDMDYDNPGWDLIRGVQTTSTEQNVLQTTERQLASTTLDWRINRKNSLRLNLEHVQINTPTRQNIFSIAWGAGNTGGATFTQGAAAGGDAVRQSMTYGDRTRGTSSAVLRYVHDGQVYKIDASANYSRSWDERKDIEHGFFRTIGTLSLGSLIVRADGWDGVYSRRAPKLTVTTRTGQAVDPYDSAGLTLSNPTSQPNEIVSDMKSLAANISRNLALGVPTTLKAGFTVNRQRKDNTSMLRTLTFAPPASVSRLAGSYDLTNESLSAQSFFNDTLKVKWVSPTKVYDLFKAHPEWFVLSESGAYQSGVVNSKYFEETISSAYVRGDVKFFDNKLWLVGGVRFERTADYGAGPLDDVRATYQQDASGNLLRDAAGRLIPVTTDALATFKRRYAERGAEARRRYSGYYPSLNVTYHVTDAIIARAAFAQTLGRPNLTEVIPGITVSDPASAVRTATIVNSGLQPWSANNYDLSFEGYGIRGAVVSLSLFKKDIRNFFTQMRIPATLPLLESFGLSDDYLDYEILTKTNGGNASAEGYEVSWRQSLSFLPPWAKGFSTYANATISHLSGPNASDFTPFAHKNINWGVSYIRRAFSFRFNVAFAYKVTGAAAAASATVPAGTASYVAPQITHDWSFEYRFAKRFTAYGGARNFNGANKRTERVGPGTPAWTRPQVYQNFGTLVTVGVRSEF
ncbi:MAG: TonB-dependent receptor [Verrucomicrobia bacterium]|nr:TonB-dependent receptor [Verrucomicrobiota bacterium]